ncbi:MAG: ABC transporter permease [Thermomicrobiales bacterium]|nr:ABC transporter permease [Thermomicrobiales bacterium]
MSRGLIGLVILSVLTISGIFADALPLSDPEVTNLDGRLTPPTWSSGEYMLGSDQLGRDILSRIIYGARVSLIVGFSTVFIAGTIGVTLGMLAGYFGRWADHIIMRVLDVVQAFPFLVLALALVAVLRPSLKSTVVILSIWGWTAYCRPVRSITLSLREKEYVAASHVVGCSSLRILVRHMLPNCIPLILVLATFQIAQLIVAESAL